jgi:hypothetical protein
MKTYEAITSTGRCTIDLDHVVGIFLQGKYIFVYSEQNKIQMGFLEEETALREYKEFVSFWSGFESGGEKCVTFPREV